MKQFQKELEKSANNEQGMYGDMDLLDLTHAKPLFRFFAESGIPRI